MRGENTMENEFRKLLGEVDDMDEFVRFMMFCFKRLNLGEDVPEIWAAWCSEKNQAVFPRN